MSSLLSCRAHPPLLRSPSAPCAHTRSLQVWAQSEQFEIKNIGAAYPASSATPTGASATGSGSSSGSGSSATTTSSATGAATTSSGTSGASGLVAPGSFAAAAFAVLGFLTTYFLLPETKLKSLEEMDELFGATVSEEDQLVAARVKRDLGLTEVESA